jgi:hypothetical protein
VRRDGDLGEAEPVAGRAAVLEDAQPDRAVEGDLAAVWRHD